jgi:hypothetical protein
MVFIHKDRFESMPKVTFHITTVYERRGETDKYTYSIEWVPSFGLFCFYRQLTRTHSRCYESLAQANDRLALISRSNADSNVVETLRHGSDYKSGCRWVTWTHPGADADKFHFYGEVKQMTMNGSVRETEPPDPQPPAALGVMSAAAEYRWSYEHRKDLAGHIWAVAVHHPDRKITVAEDGRPISQPWDLESLHEASGNAMARGKRCWNEEMKSEFGAFERFDLHYGLARYLLVPLSAGLTLAGDRPDLDTANLLQQRGVNDIAQVRVERMQVQTRTAMLAQFVPAAAITFDKPFRPLCPGREKAPRLPRVESELQALFDDAGELVGVQEEQEERLSGATRVTSPISNVSSFGRPNEALHSNPPQVYEQWAAGPPPQTPFNRAVNYDTSYDTKPYPPPGSRKRFSASLGSGIADITKKLRQQTVAMHTRRRIAKPTVDARGSPIERWDRPVFTDGTQPVLRLDTAGKVSTLTHNSHRISFR